ncbi:MAG: NAD(P)-dependent oxidoreductase [Casimicrobiaceae bacterium]
MPRIFVTFPPDSRANYYGEKAQHGLRALGDLRLNDEPRALTAAEVIAAAADCEFIVSDRQTVGDAEIFRRLPKLIAFSRCAMDIRNVDVAAASQSGVLVTRASAGFVASVAEWVIGAMIDLSRHISAAVRIYRAGEMPVPTMGRELRGSTLGVIGYGQIGRYLCELGLGMRMHVRVYDPNAKVENSAVQQSGLDELLENSDYVVCLAPALSATENLMNAGAFRKMQPSAFFINASRGELVDEAALTLALDEGWIAGCALDVGRDPDQMPSRALARHARVIATPHIAGLTPPAVEHQALETVRQIAEILAGRIPAGAVNFEHATRLARLT